MYYRLIGLIGFLILIIPITKQQLNPTHEIERQTLIILISIAGLLMLLIRLLKLTT